MADMVKSVLDCPVVAGQVHQLCRSGFLGRQSGDEICALDALAPAGLTSPLPPRDLRWLGPVEVIDRLGRDGDAPGRHEGFVGFSMKSGSPSTSPMPWISHSRSTFNTWATSVSLSMPGRADHFPRAPLSAAVSAALPVELLTILQRKINARLKRDKVAKTWFDAGLAVRYATRATDERQVSGKDIVPSQLDRSMKPAEKQGISLTHIQPKKPQQNAYVERYNWTIRRELLDLCIFESIEEMQLAVDIKQRTPQHEYRRNHLCPEVENGRVNSTAAPR